jgi:hypothetical protein
MTDISSEEDLDIFEGNNCDDPYCFDPVMNAIPSTAFDVQGVSGTGTV